jgi:hypothetical protein
LTLSNGNNITSTSLDHRPTTVFNSDTSKVLLATATSTPVTLIVEPVIGGIAASLVIAIAIVLVNIIIVCVYKKKISTSTSSDHGVETVTNEAYGYLVSTATNPAYEDCKKIDVPIYEEVPL